jgi:hypothetical protein
MSDYIEKPFDYMFGNYLKEPLEYYFDDGRHIMFGNYTIDSYGIIRNVETSLSLSYRKSGKYDRCTVFKDGKAYGILVHRAIASTFLGPPPTLVHTADHIISKKKSDNSLSNIRWLDKSEQSRNQDRPDMYKTAFVIVNDGVEKTAKEWVQHLAGKKNQFGREYTKGMIAQYAIRKQNGFSYKEYPDLEGEVWMLIDGSKNKKGWWEVSDMKRMKYATKHVSNVLWGDQLGLKKGYPTISINRKDFGCHVLAFKTFYPELWASKKPDEIVRHEKDDKLDFRPHMLLLGTGADNGKDAHDNGKYAGTKSERMPCESYINGVFEKEHESRKDAAKYLILKKVTNGDVVSISSCIGRAIVAFKKGKTLKNYGRTWKPV